MSWSYISELDEYDKEVTKDTSTTDRFTFKRYMYFKPDQYEDWSVGKSISGIPYTAELVGNPNIPSAGTYLTGSLSSFYVNDISSIKNLSEEEHGNHCSYAVVTIEYENTPSKSNDGSSSSSQDNDAKPPWQKEVDDFQITNQEIEIPFTEGYEMTGQGQTNDLVTIATTAGQPLYGFTKSIWIQRMTWTFYSHSSTSYSINAPIINSSQVSLFGGKIIIPAREGLLLPPSYKKLYYTDKKNNYKNEVYHSWSFEIVRNPMGFYTPILNAGTKAIINGNLVDICSWYTYTPNGNPPEKNLGDFSAMMAAKKEVDAYNKSITDETLKKVWSGDFVQGPIPITMNGGIDTSAVEDPDLTYLRSFTSYKEGTWNLGGV